MTRARLILVALLAMAGGALAAAADSGQALHPRFPLLDAEGKPVSQSGGALSLMRTCDGCHDTQYIATHTYHPVKAIEDCFLCHLPNPDNASRLGEIKSGRPLWAATATLGKSPLLTRNGDSWKWNTAAFDANGVPTAAFPMPRPPVSANCGLCHGDVHEDKTPFVADYTGGASLTRNEGLVYSSQRIKDSGMNIAGKEELSRPWDIHAERLLECTNCHASLNNPAYYSGGEQEKPRHLKFEPRKLAISQYTFRPDHNFGKGHAPQGSPQRQFDGTVRTCANCHDAADTHGFLPYVNRHFDALSCESCHIPATYAPSLQSTDETLLDDAGRPIATYRGTSDLSNPAVLISPAKPVILPRIELNGQTKLTPHNLVTHWYWVAGESGQRVGIDVLRRALFDGSSYRREVIAALEGDRDGKVSRDELRLDSESKVAAIRSLLEAQGLKNPRIVGEIKPYSLHHDVATGPWATRDCVSCHSSDSQTRQSITLCDYTPAGVMPTLSPGANVRLDGELAVNSAGALTYQPSPLASGRYVIGSDRWTLGDRIGLLSVLGAIVGAASHGTMRYVSRRKGATR